MRPDYRNIAILLLAGLAWISTAQAVEVQAGLMYDDNPNRSPASAWRQDSMALRVGAAWAGEQLLSPRQGILGRIELSGRHQESDSGLSRLGLALNGHYWWSLGQGFSAPALHLSLSAGWTEFDSRLRDQAGWQSQLSLAQRWGARQVLDLHVSLAGSAAESSVFDQESLRLGLGWQCQLSPRWAVDALIDWFDGEQVSSVPLGQMVFEDGRWPSTADDVYRDYASYRLPMDGLIGELGLAWQAAPAWQWRMDARWADLSQSQYAMAYADYQQMSVNLGLRWAR